MLSKLRFSMMRKTTCLIGVRVAKAVRVHGGRQVGRHRIRRRIQLRPVTGSTVPARASAAGVGEDDAAGSPDRGAAHANATAARISAAARERVRR